MCRKTWRLAKLWGTLLLGASVGCRNSSEDKSNNAKSDSATSASSVSQLDAERAFQQKRFQDSLAISTQLLSRTPDSVKLLMIAGESSTKLAQYKEAIGFYRRVPDSAGGTAATARWAAGEIHYHLGQPTACIDSLEASLRINPNLIEARQRLVWMLGVCGRRRELLPHLMALLRADQSSIETLLDMGNPWTENQNWEEIERYKKSSPDDLLPNLVYARRHQIDGELEQAELLLLSLLKQQPQLVAAHVQLGNLWLITDHRKLADWNSALPKNADEHADIWYVRGQWLEKLGNTKGSIRCLSEAASIDPNHFLAQAALAKLLKQEGENALVDALTDRSIKIQQLNQAIERVGRKNNYEPTVQQVAELNFELGRYWEAIGWSQYGKLLNPASTWHTKILKQILQSGVVNVSMPHTAAQNRLQFAADWREKFPMPEFPRGDSREVVAEVKPEPSREREPEIRFSNIAAQAGIEFVYQNSTADRSSGRRMFEVTGGGVGVLDYDGDGRPDLFLAQATPWPIPEAAPIPGDALFRNLGPKVDGQVQYREASELARIRERQFGQGVCVADINGDGFDDVYVANVGENQLWLNQGDGTFEEANSLFPKDRKHYWTVSAIAADLDGNGLTEIYDVNYVIGEDVYTLRCDIGGKPRACPPLVFKPAPQQIWIPSNQGSFDAYDWGSNELACNGLGGLAFRASDEKLPRIFIAVDLQANVLLNVSPSETQRQGFLLEDTGLISGIAFDYLGKAQACMGIAAGDVDQNGEMDLLVSNFFDESNTLYLQHGGTFGDETLKSGLAGPSRPMLGFGTQFLDVELDGDLDLVVLNGHIDDHSHVGVAEKMRPQLFVNNGGVRFQERRSKDPGNFFELPGLGRGLATVDVNQDGLLDLACSDLEAPFSLLVNQTKPLSNFLVVHLIGVQSDRNAFFTEVTALKEEFKISQQLTAGSGYIVSNQRCLHFALPAGKSTIDLEIRWPSGQVDRIQGTSANSDLTVIEGQTTQ